MRLVRRLLVLLAVFTSASLLIASPTTMPSNIPVPPAAQPSPHFDPQAATEAYLALIPPAQRARSDAYFEGGYWLILWAFLLGVVVTLLILNLRLSAKMR